jgi:CarD family transcriptional regulator
MYEVGDKVVYPQHGAGLVVAREGKTVAGVEREYLTIRIVHSEMTLMVPADGADAAGVRPVVGLDELELVLASLRGEETAIPGNWNRRFKHHRDQLRSGDVLELADVIRTLVGRARDKGLSGGERGLLTHAKGILASEIQYAKELDEAESLAYLDELLEGIAAERDGSAGPVTPST